MARLRRIGRKMAAAIPKRMAAIIMRMVVLDIWAQFLSFERHRMDSVRGLDPASMARVLNLCHD